MTQDIQQVANPFGAPAHSDHHAVGASATAASSREVAEVQAALIGARMNPRNPQQSMARIIDACGRKGLAEVAIYQYSRGGTDISGPSIRLAEEMARQWGNIACGIVELSRGRGYSECLAYCWDLESNYRDEKRFQVKHWRDTRGGGYQLTDERDIYELIANMGSRRKRACILSVIPGDVQEAAVRQAEVTLKAGVEITDESLAKILAAFEKFGVTREQIEKRLQRRFDADTVGPGQVLTLRKIYTSINDGMSTPEDWFETPEARAADAKQSARDKMDAFAAGGEAKPAEEKPAPEPAREQPAERERRPEPEPEPAAEAEPAPEDIPGLFGEDS